MHTTGAAMSEELQPHSDAATLLRRWFDEVWNRGMESTIEELFPADAVMWGIGRPEVPSHGPAEFKAFHAAMRRAAPDIHVELHQVIQDGDTAFARWTASMTHTGEGLGISPTHKKLKLCGMSALRAHNGVIAEGWNVWDQVGMARELGVLEGHAAVLFQ